MQTLDQLEQVQVPNYLTCYLTINNEAAKNSWLFKLFFFAKKTIKKFSERNQKLVCNKLESYRNLFAKISKLRQKVEGFDKFFSTGNRKGKGNERNDSEYASVRL